MGRVSTTRSTTIHWLTPRRRSISTSTRGQSLNGSTMGRWPGMARALRRESDPCLMAANGNIFETSWYMRGFERMFMDFILNPEFAHSLLDRVCDFYVEHFTRTLSAIPGEVDLVFTADDIGGQEGLLMSLEMWETFIKPRHARLNRRIHELGARVIYHSDGAVMEAVPGLIDMGIDVLQALQFDARGMDPAKLKREFGTRLCFEGWRERAEDTAVRNSRRLSATR